MLLRTLKIFLILFCCSASVNLFSQTKQIDSLRIKINEQKNLNNRQDLIMLMCEHYYSLSADSLLRYINLGISLSDSKSTAYFRFKNFYCVYLFKTGKSAQAFLYSDSLLQMVSAIKNKEIIELEILANKSSALIRNNQYKEAINENLVLLEKAEKLKDTLNVMKAYTLIGWANMELENYREAISWFTKGLNYTDNELMLSSASALYNNLASCYNNLNQKDSAMYFINKGIQSSEENENLTNHANGLNIRAAIYLKEKKISEAETDLKSALSLREKIGDQHYVISDLGQLAAFYASVNEPKKGIAIAQKGIALAIEGNNLSKLIFLNTSLAQNYKAANQKDEYAKTLSTIILLKDSLYKNNSEDAIAEMITKYELQKKENIITQQENKIIKNNYFYLGSVLVFVLLLIFIWVVYRNYTHVQHRKMENALAEERILSVKAIQHAEEKERKRIAADLHDNLGSYAAAITSNISYLKEGINKENKFIISQLDENAKGIVTNLSDSIWVLKNEQLPITKLADRFKAWTQRMIQNYPNVKYYYEEDITNDIEFTPYKILNIFLILKECLNNSLKHSNCSEIRIQFTSNGNLHFSIEDNGKGFQSNVINRGNGIENINHRAKECNLFVEWVSLSPSGTRVTIYENTTN